MRFGKSTQVHYHYHCIQIPVVVVEFLFRIYYQFLYTFCWQLSIFFSFCRIVRPAVCIDNLSVLWTGIHLRKCLFFYFFPSVETFMMYNAYYNNLLEYQSIFLLVHDCLGFSRYVKLKLMILFYCVCLIPFKHSLDIDFIQTS